MARARAACAAGLKKHLPALPTPRWKALVTSSHVAEPRLLFVAFKKKVSLSAVRSQCNCMARARAACAAGLKKHLPALPTPRWKALVTSSHVAEPRLLFIAFKKIVSLSAVRSVARAVRSVARAACAAGLRQHQPTDFITSMQNGLPLTLRRAQIASGAPDQARDVTL
jgi:hypothetical protein